MRSTRIPYRGVFAHTANGTSTTMPAISTLSTPVNGNTIPLQASMNTIVVQRDGFYKISLDSAYINAAGTSFYSRVFINGNNFITAPGNQSVVASAPGTSITRITWLKAGDRITVGSGHNETSVVRDVVGNVILEELIP